MECDEMKNVEKKRPPKITANQLAVFRHIDLFMTEHGRAPDPREMMNSFGWKAHSTYSEYTHRLVDHGFLIDTPTGLKIGKRPEITEAKTYHSQEKKPGKRKVFLWDTEKPEVKLRTKWLTMPWRKSA
jgi:hypothetical protein